MAPCGKAMQTSLSTLTGDFCLRRILSLEDDPELLAYHCPGTTIPVWALIRVAFIRTIMSDLFYKTAPLKGKNRQINPIQAVKYLVCCAAHNGFHYNDFSSDICFFSSALGNIERNSQIFDRLVGYFADIYPENSLIYQDHAGFQKHYNLHYQSIMYDFPFRLLSWAVGRIKLQAKHIRLANNVLHCASTNALVRLSYIFKPEDLASLKFCLAQQLAEMPFVTDYFANWFAKRKIKLLLKDCASYGARSVPILAAARRAGVTTAEYQHGAISAGHDGYNVASTLLNSPEFQQTLPEYLLTYGEWWGEQTNMPFKRVVIGNPHFTESIKHIPPGNPARKHILILGDGIETELYLDLAKHVAEVARRRGMRVCFRPHPIERDRAERMDFPSGVELDKNSDVYQSFAIASIVISELSTGLFEAARLVDRVVIWDTAKARFAFPELPFPAFTSFSELDDALFLRNQAQADINGNDVANSKIWAENWQLNYKNFVESVISK